MLGLTHRFGCPLPQRQTYRAWYQPTASLEIWRRRNRTFNLRVWNPLLFHLSYSPVCGPRVWFEPHVVMSPQDALGDRQTLIPTIGTDSCDEAVSVARPRTIRGLYTGGAAGHKARRGSPRRSPGRLPRSSRGRRFNPQEHRAESASAERLARASAQEASVAAT